MPDTHKASCFCGAVEVEVTGAPLEMGYCHCSSCRSYSGAPLVAYVLFRSENVNVTNGAERLRGFSKTEMSDRKFCTKCGGHILTVHPTLGLTDLRAAAIPALPFRPTVHLNYAEAVLPIRDGLPKLRNFPVAAGGSGETVPE